MENKNIFTKSGMITINTFNMPITWFNDIKCLSVRYFISYVNCIMNKFNPTDDKVIRACDVTTGIIRIKMNDCIDLVKFIPDLEDIAKIYNNDIKEVYSIRGLRNNKTPSFYILTNKNIDIFINYFISYFSDRLNDNIIESIYQLKDEYFHDNMYLNIYQRDNGDIYTPIITLNNNTIKDIVTNMENDYMIKLNLVYSRTVDANMIFNNAVNNLEDIKRDILLLFNSNNKLWFKGKIDDIIITMDKYIDKNDVSNKLSKVCINKDDIEDFIYMDSNKHKHIIRMYDQKLNLIDILNKIVISSCNGLNKKEINHNDIYKKCKYEIIVNKDNSNDIYINILDALMILCKYCYKYNNNVVNEFINNYYNLGLNIVPPPTIKRKRPTLF